MENDIDSDNNDNSDKNKDKNNFNLSSEIKKTDIKKEDSDEINDTNNENLNIIKEVSNNQNIKNNDKEKDEKFEISDEEKSTSKLLDLSLKKVSLTLGQIYYNPELRERINNDYKNNFNEMNKYITNILELDKNDFIQKIISKLNFYDKKHSFYSNEINNEDICSIITYALTSDQYLDAVKIDNKNGLNDIKTEFKNNEQGNDIDNDLFCNTSLLYDRDKIKFSMANLTEEKISQILENELLSSTNKKCIYEVSYNPSQIFNEVFEKKKKKRK